MKYVKFFENFTEEEDLDFLNNVKDILLEYAEKYDLVETGTGKVIPDDWDWWENFHSHNGHLKCTIVKPTSKSETNFIEVIISIKDYKSAVEFVSGDVERAISRLKIFGYKVQKVNQFSNKNYSLLYRLFIYR
jgi:hypothetical protein